MSISPSSLILAVDDNPTNLATLSQTLKHAGWQVRVAIDGESAIAKAHYEPPDLILLDVEMPGMNGFEVCQQLKANAVTQSIPVIFTTALADLDSKVKGLSLGAVDYIIKPFEAQEVVARVQVHLQLRRLTKMLEEKSALLEASNTALQQLTQALEERVQERTAALEMAQVRLVQQEKLSVLGELVTGVAHEINNPVNFIASNIEPAQDYVADLTRILQLYQQHYPHPVPEVAAELAAVDLDFVLEDLTKLLTSMQLGANRLRALSNSLRTFSRTDTDTKVSADIHTGLDSTLMILGHRLKATESRASIQVIKNYGDLPKIECYLGQLNQVFMNILANAIDALEEANLRRSPQEREAIPNQIAITTQVAPDQQHVSIQIQDNGIGMSDEVRSRIFERSFTTKAVGKGTGLGLSISQQIIAETHGGSLQCESVAGAGSVFTITLPIAHSVSSDMSSDSWSRSTNSCT
ncbi:MAG: hybrid sensor histidine kinase/response regulator [Leptolyngbya sp. IPPAS B-1204]|nr:hybrid sensor histidine kinase/response regulator [Elainella sp. C42_A2020_010]RNJ67465.1 MAG: hybrid sensor histidine kinase/response regulator [Leptolyngbya sp. IPPAS B-1204]